MSTIICPVDFREPSFQAARIAAIIAQKSDAQLLFLHSAGSASDEARERVFTGMERLGFHVGSAQMKEPQFVVSPEGISDSINALNHKKDIGLVVMATDGISNLTELSAGTHTENVASKTNVPVLAIPAGAKLGTFNSILFATDYEKTSKADIESLLLFAKIFNATVEIIHVSRDENPVSKGVFEMFSNDVRSLFGNDVTITRVIAEDVAAVMIQLSVEKNIDLMVVHKDKFQVNDRSKTSTLLRMAEFPLLVLRS